jgi:translocation and assembly module TamB
MHGELSLHGTMDRPTVRLQLAAAQVVLPPTIKYLPPGPFNLNCDLLAAPDRYSFSTLRLTAPSLTLEAAGDWLSPPSLKEIITAPQFPRLTGVLDMSTRLAVSDFRWTARHIEAIRRLDGRLDMEAALTGPAEKPTLLGTIRLTDGELRTSYEIPSVQDIQLAVAFDTDRIDISRLSGELGGAPFTVTGKITEYTSANPVIDLIFQGKNLLLHRSDGMNIRSDADLIFRGVLNRLSVSGDLAISDGRFTKKFDFLRSVTESTKSQQTQGLQLFSFKEPPLSRASLAVGIQTKKGFLIKNNLAQGFIRPDLLLGGTGELPVIQGTVYLDPIKIKLPSGFLTIDSGLVRFTETQPDRPQVDMTGTATIMGYEITMLINGPIDEPVVTLSSAPPLPDDELLLLVLTGTPPKSGTGGGSMQKSTMNVAVYLGRSVLDGWFKSNGTESDDSILERFELEIGRGITRRGEETIDARFRLAENVLRDGDVIFITGQKDVYDYINTGIKIVFRFQ